MQIASDSRDDILYSADIPPGTACLLWRDLIVGSASLQGIYYQIDDYGAASQLSVEYILRAYDNEDGEMNHGIIAYLDDAVADVDFYYFGAGDGGSRSTVGVQGYDSRQSKSRDLVSCLVHIDASIAPQAVLYEYHSLGTINPGL